MAIKTDITVTSIKQERIEGISLPAVKSANVLKDCYIKVETVQGDKETVSFSASLTSGGFSIRRSFAFSPDMDGPNFIKQAYLHLKSLPEYARGEDV